MSALFQKKKILKRILLLISFKLTVQSMRLRHRPLKISHEIPVTALLTADTPTSCLPLSSGPGFYDFFGQKVSVWITVLDFGPLSGL